MDLADLADPIEVWRAVEGDPTDLIVLLRSDEPIRRRTRDALADFLAGALKPFVLPRGRPSKPDSVVSSHMRHSVWYGHDVATKIGFAGFRYEHMRRFIRSKGWHLDNPGWSDGLKAAIAKRHSIELEQFINYLRRSRPKAQTDDRPWSAADYIDRRRHEIALEIRRTKTPENG